MDNNNKHVQIEDNKKTAGAKPEEKYVIFFSDAQTPEGDPGKYIAVTGLLAAFAELVKVQAAGATKTAVYKKVDLKITVH